MILRTQGSLVAVAVVVLINHAVAAGVDARAPSPPPTTVTTELLTTTDGGEVSFCVCVVLSRAVLTVFPTKQNGREIADGMIISLTFLIFMTMLFEFLKESVMEMVSARRMHECSSARCRPVNVAADSRG